LVHGGIGEDTVPEKPLILEICREIVCKQIEITNLQ
jgi:hypothetical protein